MKVKLVKLEVEMYEYHYCNCLVLDVYLLCLNRRFCLAVCWCILLVGHFLKQIIHDNSSLTSRRHDSVQCDCSVDTTQSFFLSINHSNQRMSLKYRVFGAADETESIKREK